MPNAPAKSAKARFDKLVDDIAFLYRNAREAMTRSAREMGRRIVEEEQNGEMRAVYGARLIPRLSEELTRRHGPGFSETTLKDVRLFFLQNRKSQRVGELPWGRHLQIMRLKDPRAREALQKRAVRENLGRDAIRQIVSKANRTATAKPLPPLTRPTDLKLNTYKKFELAGSLKQESGRGKPVLSSRLLPPASGFIDCGFFVILPLDKSEVASVTITDTPSYTYAATVERVVDGDTLLVLIDVGFDIILRDKLRLRGINCPELGTPEGESAKKFVQKLLPAGATIVLKSHKDDKYGRFVADLFYLNGSDSSEEIIASGAYLNQDLLDKGYAFRMAE